MSPDELPYLDLSNCVVPSGPNELPGASVGQAAKPVDAASAARGARALGGKAKAAAAKAAAARDEAETDWTPAAELEPTKMVATHWKMSTDNNHNTACAAREKKGWELREDVANNSRGTKISGGGIYDSSL